MKTQYVDIQDWMLISHNVREIEVSRNSRGRVYRVEGEFYNLPMIYTVPAKAVRKYGVNFGDGNGTMSFEYAAYLGLVEYKPDPSRNVPMGDNYSSA
jgi:hypothetical protein